MLGNKSIGLILVRHGNTFESGVTPTQVGAKTDLSLTAQGRVQAEQVGKYLVAKKIIPAAIYAGPLKRQIESAEIIKKALPQGRLFKGEKALSEIDYGLWEGLTSEEITARFPKEYSNWTETSEWAEGIFEGSLQGHLFGIESFLSKVLYGQNDGDTVIAVTSNGVIRLFYSFLKDEWQKLKKERQMDKLKVKTGHLCELVITHDSLKVQSWNKSPIS